MSNGPIFEAGAGWGTRFSVWARGNLAYILPGIVILALIIVFAFSGGSQNIMDMESPSPSITQITGVGTREIVRAGDSYTTVARRMIHNMLSAEQSGQVSKGALLYTETEMSRILQPQPLVVGAEISTTRDTVWGYLNGYDSLYPSQKTKWEFMASRVQF